MATKKERQRLKAPDAFQVKMMSYLDSLAKHKMAVFSVSGCLILITLSFVGWRFFQNHQSEKRLVALAKIDQIFLDEEDLAQTKRKAILEKVEELEKKVTAKEQKNKDEGIDKEEKEKI